VAYRQLAKSITADEAGLPEPPISPKRNLQEDSLSQLAAEARRQRIRIREIVMKLNDPSDQHSVDLANPLPRVVDKFSDPSLKHALAFPFVGFVVSDRFKVDNTAERNWPYVGRTKFKELVERLKLVRNSHVKSAVWLYGTQGYGKSHLLAALACYLAAQDERVVYIPDCQA
jgi:chromosomal replication initiation ATPase DnaA